MSSELITVAVLCEGPLMAHRRCRSALRRRSGFHPTEPILIGAPTAAVGRFRATPEAPDCKHELPLSAESTHIRQDELAARFPKLPFMNALAQMVGLAAKRIFTPCGVGEPAISGNA
jgi:hypothetical protein